MKRYGYLFEKITDIDNIILAHKNARKKKTHYYEVKEVDKDVLKYALQIKKMLEDQTYRTSDYEVKTKKDKNKVREIYKLPYYPDRIVHHAIMQILEPIWKNSMISNTYQSIKNRGPHKAIKKVTKEVKYTQNMYYLKIDIKKYYPSIDNYILKRKVRSKIKCNKTLMLLDTIIDSCNGVPIGNYISQYFGNIHLNSLDHKIIRIDCVKYFRYCDDIVLLSTDKSTLYYSISLIKEELNSLKLKLKPVILNILSIKSALDFLGYKVYINRVLLRKTIKVKALKYISSKNICSYKGWLEHCDGYNLTTKLIRRVNDTIT